MSQSMVYSQMLIVFLQYGVVESNSPKNRRRLYEQLKKDQIKWKNEIIGYTTGKKFLCRWVGKRAVGWDLGRIVKWIQEKRLIKEDLEKACQDSDIFNFDDIKEVFNNNMPLKEKYNLIQEKWGNNLEWVKYTPFDMCYIRKTIVRITKI